MKKKPRKRGALAGNTNAAKPKKEKRVPLQVRISPESAKLLKVAARDYDGNQGRALDEAIGRAWNSCMQCGAVPKRGGERQGAELCEDCFNLP